MNNPQFKKDVSVPFEVPTFISDIELKDYVLAEGSLPKRAENREVKYSVTFLSEGDYNKIRDRAESQENDPLSEIPSGADFPLSSVEKGALVDKNQEVASLSQGKTGKGGKDIFGAIYDGLPGNDPQIRILENIKINKVFLELF